MSDDLCFQRVQTITHNGKVILFGQSPQKSEEPKEDVVHKLWYRVLDLDQVADVDNPNAWDDNTRWTEWMELSYPDELRTVAMSMLTVRPKMGGRLHDRLHGWQALSDDSFIYLFRAIDFTSKSDKAKNIRVYANRYTLVNIASPGGGKNRAAGGKQLTVPQLKPVYEARYRRSRLRETPQSDTDGQGFLDAGSLPFLEPVMEFAMVAPVEGRFTVTLAPSAVPGRERWQFFWQHDGEKLAALSLLRDEDGWVDLAEKDETFNQLDNPEGRYRLLPDRLFTIRFQGEDLALAGHPASLMFRRQEESSSFGGSKEQMLSGKRVMLAGRFKRANDSRLVVVDFDLDDQGVADIPEVVEVGTVHFARTALHLNGETDEVRMLKSRLPPTPKSMSFHAWVRHNQGKGTLAERGYDPETGEGSGFAIEWHPDADQLVATLALNSTAQDGQKRVPVLAPLPTSHTWHHIALVVDESQAALHVDAKAVGDPVKIPEGYGFAAAGDLIIGGRSKESDRSNWLDFEIDQVVLWAEKKEPQRDEIYYELNDEMSADPKPIGYWQMDVEHNGSTGGTSAQSVEVRGAEHVNQTAPIFKRRTDMAFEETLGNLSVGMGLIDKEIGDDPQLFLNADGLIHLYTTAVSHDQKQDQQENYELVTLQYDTTTTRAQFSFPWSAGEEAGELILTARTAGPIMNRLTVTLRESATSALDLAIEYPGQKLVETWKQLPADVESLVSILNGEAIPSKDRQKATDDSNENLLATDEDSEEEEQITYDYAQHVCYGNVDLETILKHLLSEQGSKRGQHSQDAADVLEQARKFAPELLVRIKEFAARKAAGPTFVAASTALPANGASAQVQLSEGGEAQRRQQGNFGGWIHAPVPTSGHFGSDVFDEPVLATLDLKQDALQGLGDFAIEAWVRPDDNPVDELVKGKATSSRILNLCGLSANDRFALGLRPAASLKLTNVKVVHVPNKPLLSSRSGERDRINDKGQPEDTGSTSQEFYNESFTVRLRFNTPARKEQVGSLFQLVSADKNHMFYAEVSYDSVFFKVINGTKQAKEVRAAFGVTRGGPVNVAFVWDINTGDKEPQNLNGHMRLYIDGKPLASEPVEAANYGSIVALKLGKPNLTGPYSQGIGELIENLKTYLAETPADKRGHRLANVGHDFYQGCGLALDDVRIWDFALSEDEMAVSNLPQHDMPLHWEINKLLSSSEVNKVQVQNKDRSAREGKDFKDWVLIFGETDIKPGYRTLAAVGERGVLSNTAIGTNTWSHVAVVCTGNHALQFNGRNQRAIFKDSGGLNPEKAFSIDCTMCWAGWSADEERQYIFSRSNLTQTDMVFQLGIRREGTKNGKAFLRFTFTNNEGEIVTHEEQSQAALQPGVSYHLVAHCALREKIYESNDPIERHQAWQLDAGVWIFDVVASEWANDPAERELPEALDLSKIKDVNSKGIGAGHHHLFYITDNGETNYQIGLRRSEVAACIGSLSGEGKRFDNVNQGWFQGLIGHLRFWTQRLDAGMIKKLPWSAALPDGVPKPAANWRLEENRGLQVLDAAGGMTASLTDETMWTTTRLTSQLSLYINGLLAASTNISDGYSIDYGLTGKLSFGGVPRRNATILLIGDRLSAGSIEKPFLKVTAESSSHDALKWLTDNRVDAVIVAMSSSGTNTVNDVHRILESKGAHQSTPIIHVGDANTGAADMATWFFARSEQEIEQNIRNWLQRYLQKPLSGRLDEIRVWNDLRTQEEIYDSRHVLLGGNEDNLVGYWPITTGSGQMLKDTSGHGNHAQLSNPSDGDFKDFWAIPERMKPAPVGNELPQVRNLLDGKKTGASVDNLSEVASCGVAEYGDVQSSPQGKLQAVMKRCLVYLDSEGRCQTRTGFKVGDLDLVYVGQAQSDPTLIGYIEGAPPVPSENATKPYYTSALSYNAYDDTSSVQLVEAENTVQLFSADSNTGFDQSLSMSLGVGLGDSHIEIGYAFGGAYLQKMVDWEANIKAQLAIDGSSDSLSKSGATIGTARTLINKIGTSGDWEVQENGRWQNPAVGRRYVYSNEGYALVKSGVANIYSMKMRQSGSLMGLILIPDPEVREDYNIIMFPIQSSYTKQGTLDGMIGHVPDNDFAGSDRTAASYYRPREVNNLVKEIEAYEARIAANYANFDAGRLGRREMALYRPEDDPAANAQGIISEHVEMPYDWERQISKRNIVNSYVWTAGGGLFVEQQETNVVREESEGGAYSMQTMGGVSADGNVSVSFGGITWDINALFGGHIRTTVLKTKQEGRNFGVNVDLNVDGLLRGYTGDPTRYYTKDDVPWKVTSYRFKTFYLTPDKKHFQDFWSKVVSRQWLEQSNDPNAQALRAARGNLNHVWRVLHRVTYVSRVPPRGDKIAVATVQPGRAVIHQTPNMAIISLVLKQIADKIPEVPARSKEGRQKIREVVGKAVVKTVDEQWAYSVPWWQNYLDEAKEKPGTPEFAQYLAIKQAVSEYMVAYVESGAYRDHPLFRPPEEDLPGIEPWIDGEPVDTATLASLARRAGHLYTFSEKQRATDAVGVDDIELREGASVVPDGTNPEISGCLGKLILPADKPKAHGRIAVTYDWGRDQDRTWEIVFRLTDIGSRTLLAHDPGVQPQQRLFKELGIDDKGDLFIQPVGSGEPTRLFRLDDDHINKTIFMALRFQADHEELSLTWRIHGDPQHTKSLHTPKGWIAGGWLYLGGGLTTASRAAGLEIYHFAVYSGLLDQSALQKRYQLLKLNE